VFSLIEELVRKETGDTIRFEPNKEFHAAVLEAARLNPLYLWTADPADGVGRLNAIVAAQALQALLEPEIGSEYVGGGAQLYTLTRKGGRGQRDRGGPTPSQTLLPSKHVSKWFHKQHQHSLRMQDAYLSADNGKFDKFRPRQTSESVLRAEV
jgi:hypothetical protein